MKNNVKFIDDAKGKRLSEVIHSNEKISKTTFFSNPNSAFQFGFVSHQKGYEEKAHYHKRVEKKIFDVSQVLFVQKGKVIVDFYNEDKTKIIEVNLNRGDAINIIRGIHRIRVLEDCQCLTVKQGPFISDEMDKVEVSFDGK